MTNEEFFRSLNYENGIQAIEAIFRRFPMQYAATIGLDGKPQLRPLEFKFQSEGKLYFDTVDTYESYREMQANPYIMICIGDQESQTYVRLQGKVHFTKEKEAVERCFSNSRVLKEQFGDHPEKVIAYYIEDARAEFATFLPGLQNRKWDLDHERDNESSCTGQSHAS